MVKKTKNELPEILKPYNEEIKRHMSTLSEEFQSRVAIIGEAVSLVNEKVDKISDTLDSHTEMIGQLMVDVTEVKNTLKTKVDAKEVLRIVKANV